MTRKVLVTSATLYANGKMHFGHLAGAYLTADCYARFERMQGSDVLFISGSDEYGVAITMSAELAGNTPQEHVNLYHEMNKALFKRLNFSFDNYTRTTWEGHKEPVDEFFNDLLANGYIESKETEQLYSESDDRFMADRYVTGTCPRCKFEEARGDECPKCGASFEATDLGNPRSKQTGAPLILKKTTHWYLLLDKLADNLRTWLSEKKWKPTVLHFLSHYVDDLRPRAITRDSSWGIPVPLPEAEGKVFYVWFEACIGYISGSREWAIKQGDPDLWKKWWCDEKTHFVQFIGKDNTFFHGLFFPAMTMAQNQPYKLVDELPANEFLNLEGRQFSKSDNWTIDLEEFLTKYSPDQIRYTLAANAPESSDSEFTWRDFEMRCNTELVGKFGNLANRALVFAGRYCEGKAPTMHTPDDDFLSKLKKLTEEARTHYKGHSLRKVCHIIMEVAHLGNIYFDANKPWVAAKSEETRAEMENTIAHCLEAIKALAVIAAPLIPESATKLWHLLGCQGEIPLWDEALTTPLAGSALPKPEILFEKIPPEQIEEEINALKEPLGKS